MSTVSLAGLLDGVRLSWADLPQERYNKLKQVSGLKSQRSAQSTILANQKVAGSA